jgi:hypothetical protein
MTREEHLEQLKSWYYYVEVYGDGNYVAYYPLLMHWTIISGHLDLTYGYEDRWCFGDQKNVEDCFNAWKAKDFNGEPEGWVRHPKTGRRRINGDPATEYINY